MPTFSNISELFQLDGAHNGIDVTVPLPKAGRLKHGPGLFGSFATEGGDTAAAALAYPRANRLPRSTGDFLGSASDSAFIAGGGGSCSSSSSSRLSSSSSSSFLRRSSASNFFGPSPSDTPDDEREALAVTNVLPHGDKGGPHDPLTSFSASSEEARDLHQEALEASEEKADAALDEATAASQATSSALRDALEATDHADEAEEIADIAVMVNLVASAMATIVAFVCYLNYKQWLEVRKERKWCHVMACQEDENNNPARP
mmetsp:Transcript_92877/g.194111  ORF Transcript_92877/g.194111 Transcript_92877/m.194111 type:complete len:260 (+) Transcript_92877:70-849(+)